MDQVPQVVRFAAVASGLAVAAATGGSAPLAAQQQPRGTLRGVVYDSLVRAPLSGARIWIDGTTLTTTTDGRGRFRLDSVPAGFVVVTFDHPALDSIGLTSPARRVAVQPGATAMLQLSVPAMATMWRTACGDDPRPAGRGVVFGSVFDVEGNIRLAGARVQANWIAFERTAAGIDLQRPSLEAVTDSLGNYYLCGAPLDQNLTLTAQAGGFVSGDLTLVVGPRGLNRLDVGISRDSGAVVLDSTGLRRGRAVVAGSVLDETGAPLPGALASVDGAAGETSTNADGRFVLGGLPAGTRMVSVRMVGFAPGRAPVSLRSTDTTRTAFHLARVTLLDTIRVTASRGASPLLDELAERLRQGWGHALVGDQLTRAPSTRAVLQQLPSLEVVGRSAFTYRLVGRSYGRPCSPPVFVDGFRADTDILSSIRPSELVAVEWFPRASSAPVRYSTMGDCGVVLLWTRQIQ